MGDPPGSKLILCKELRCRLHLVPRVRHLEALASAEFGETSRRLWDRSGRPGGRPLWGTYLVHRRNFRTLLIMASKQIASDRPSRLPTITAVEPSAAIAGGELHIRGRNLAVLGRPSVQLGGQQAHLVIAGDSYLIVKVPDSTTVGEVVVKTGDQETSKGETRLGVQI